MNEPIQFTRIANDTNGNPRYVVHYLNLLTPAERAEYRPGRYELAVKRANKIGGRKYHTRSYGGGIVFQSYSLQETESAIRDIVAKES